MGDMDHQWIGRVRGIDHRDEPKPCSASPGRGDEAPVRAHGHGIDAADVRDRQAGVGRDRETPEVYGAVRPARRERRPGAAERNSVEGAGWPGENVSDRACVGVDEDRQATPAGGDRCAVAAEGQAVKELARAARRAGSGWPVERWPRGKSPQRRVAIPATASVLLLGLKAIAAGARPLVSLPLGFRLALCHRNTVVPLAAATSCRHG